MIYRENIYDVYVNNSNQSDYVSEMKEYITHNQPVRSDQLNNRFDLIEGHVNNNGDIDQEDFDEIEVASLFMFIIHCNKSKSNNSLIS